MQIFCHSAQLLQLQLAHRPEMNRQLPLLHEEIELASHFTERIHGNAEGCLLAGDDVYVGLHQQVQEDTDLVVMAAHVHSGRRLWP